MLLMPYLKKEAGDSSEWDALVTSRTNIKNKYPKS